MTQNVILNFGLLFETSFANELVEASQGFLKQKKLQYFLGDRSLPHVTILQFPYELEQADKVWAKLKQIEMPSIKLNFHGLGLDRFRTWDALWLRTKHCPELRKVQEDALKILGPMDYVNGQGTLYEPHATLATWPSENTLPPLTIPSSILERKNMPVFYTLGVSGPDFQYERCLFR